MVWALHLSSWMAIWLTPRSILLPAQTPRMFWWEEKWIWWMEKCFLVGFVDWESFLWINVVFYIATFLKFGKHFSIHHMFDFSFWWRKNQILWWIKKCFWYDLLIQNEISNFCRIGFMYIAQILKSRCFSSPSTLLWRYFLLWRHF